MAARHELSCPVDRGWGQQPVTVQGRTAGPKIGGFRGTGGLGEGGTGTRGDGEGGRDVRYIPTH